jgi:hypothetical protein
MVTMIKKMENKVLTRMWEHQNSHTFRMGRYNDPATVEKSSQKLKYGST